MGDGWGGWWVGRWVGGCALGKVPDLVWVLTNDCFVEQGVLVISPLLLLLFLFF